MPARLCAGRSAMPMTGTASTRNHPGRRSVQVSTTVVAAPDGAKRYSHAEIGSGP
jgi:hypothetical protein